MIINKGLAGLAVVLYLVAAPATGADLGKGDLFSSDQALSVTISAQWRELIKEKDEKAWPATMTVENPGGAPLVVPLTVERRGISRQRICDFPPIRLRFDKEAVDGTLFDGEGALKLVTHCNRGERWTRYYVLEMLIYRMYNLVTDYSFRVRPMRLIYDDVDRNKDAEEHFGFVIEDIDEVADRHDLTELEPASTLPSQLDSTVSSQVALFQFMIGNLDWSALRGPGGVCCHNVKLIGAEGSTTGLIPIPYDFDATGLVDASYASPPEGLKVRSVRNRMFRGYCRQNDTLPAARQQLAGLASQIRTVVQAEPRLEERDRQEALEYLDEFFEILNDDEEFEDEVIAECRG